MLSTSVLSVPCTGNRLHSLVRRVCLYFRQTRAFDYLLLRSCTPNIYKVTVLFVPTSPNFAADDALLITLVVGHGHNCWCRYFSVCLLHCWMFSLQLSSQLLCIAHFLVHTVSGECTSCKCKWQNHLVLSVVVHICLPSPSFRHPLNVLSTRQTHTSTTKEQRKRNSRKCVHVTDDWPHGPSLTKDKQSADRETDTKNPYFEHMLMVCFRGHSTDRVTAKLSTSVIRLRPLSCFISISSGLFQSELVLLTDSLPVNVHTFPDDGDAWSAEVCTTKLGNVVSMNESSSSSSPKGGCSVTC